MKKRIIGVARFSDPASERMLRDGGYRDHGAGSDVDPAPSTGCPMSKTFYTWQRVSSALRAPNT